jgi:hypothetical protein
VIRRGVVTRDDLELYGLTLEEVRSWPIPEYGPASSPYWLLSDLQAAGLVPDDEDQ